MPVFDEEIGYVASVPDADASFQAGAAVLDACKEVSFNSGGQQITGSIGAMSFPTVGQRSRAWAMTFSAQGITFGFDVVLTQKGQELALLGYGDLGAPDLTELTKLAGLAVARLR